MDPQLADPGDVRAARTLEAVSFLLHNFVIPFLVCGLLAFFLVKLRGLPTLVIGYLTGKVVSNAIPPGTTQCPVPAGDGGVVVPDVPAASILGTGERDTLAGEAGVTEEFDEEKWRQEIAKLPHLDPEKLKRAVERTRNDPDYRKWLESPDEEYPF